MASRRTERRARAVGLAALVFAAAPASADDADEARIAFEEGTKLVVAAKWAEALAAFERAEKKKPHPVTTFDIAACERAMGRYTRARTTLRRALREHETGEHGKLPDNLVTDAKAWDAEIDKLLARAQVTLLPEGANVLVDGRPLAVESTTPRVLVAGVRPVGPGEPAPAGTFTVLLDPGPHVLLLQRKGFTDAVVNRTFGTGSSTPLELHLDKLPATLRIVADRESALVTVDGKDVGPAPVDVLRPAGSYRIVVTKVGHVPFDQTVKVGAGESLRVSAVLPVDEPAITKRWWFWAGSAVLVGGVALGTWYLTRPAPTRPEVDGGSLGWKIQVP